MSLTHRTIASHWQIVSQREAARAIAHHQYSY
jgi:hypothetical protein